MSPESNSPPVERGGPTDFDCEQRAHSTGSMGDRKFMFTWRDAIRSSELPSTTRLVLYVISFHLNLDGSSAFPTQETVARECGLSLRAVKKHLELAQQSGWLTRSPRIRHGHASFRFGTDYVPRIPTHGARSTAARQSEIAVETEDAW
jgi:hypothetical protein